MTTDFGRDTACIDSLRTGRYATGVRMLAQRCYHRLITPRGMLRGGEHEGNFGLDLAGMVGSTGSVALLSASIGASIENELRKDAEVESASAIVEATVDSDGSMSWTISVDVQSALGPFNLVLGVSGVTVELLGLEGVP
jgi:hypothetical protein